MSTDSDTDTDQHETPGQLQGETELDTQAELDTSDETFERGPKELPKRALVIVAHPDDAEFGSAATVAKWTNDGWEVWFCIVTDASGGGDDHATDVGPEARKAISGTRKAEQRASGEVLGLAGVEFLDYPDGRIEPTLELRRDIVRLIRRIKPSILISPSPDRRWDPFFIGRHHPDHLAVGTATTAAVYPAARNAWDFPELLEEGLEPHRIIELWIVGAPVQNHFVDVSDTIEQKVEALRCHHSQLGSHFDELADNIRRGLAQTGAKYGVAAAEEFYRAVIG
jgi:LmbE family N-acetylglucosaminyl deacetylase